MAQNGRTVKVSGDYNIIAGQGNTILLDTGPNIGYVRVTGNLIVEGDTLTVEATNLNVEDNIIILNYGDPGPGVTVGDGYSGIQIDRGSEAPATFLWDEDSQGWQLALGLPDTGFNWSSSKLRLKEITTDSGTDDGDLNLIGAGVGVVKVLGTNNYENQVTHDDDIPNKKYVDNAIQTNPTFQIRSPGASTAGDTRVVSLDATATYPPGTFPFGPFITQPAISEVAVLVNDRRIAAFRDNHIEFTGLTIFTEDPVVGDIAAAMGGNYNPGPLATNLSGYENQSAVVIQADNTNTNIRLETNGTGKVVITYAQSFEHHGLSPAAVSSASLIYGATPGSGTTGLRFVNTRPSKELDGTINASFTNDELISKNRALLFSMLF